LKREMIERVKKGGLVILSDMVCLERIRLLVYVFDDSDLIMFRFLYY
jgi:hypothetical protein